MAAGCSPSGPKPTRGRSDWRERRPRNLVRLIVSPRPRESHGARGSVGFPTSAGAARTWRSPGSPPTTAATVRSRRTAAATWRGAPRPSSGASPNDGQHYPAVAGAAGAGDPRVPAYSTAPRGAHLRRRDARDSERLSRGGSRRRGLCRRYGPAVLPFATRSRSRWRDADATRARSPAVPSRAARRSTSCTGTADDGATWDGPVRLANAADAQYRVNDEPSLAVTGRTQRVSYDRYQRSFSRYDVWGGHA